MLCVSVLCCVRAVCLSLCENKLQHTAQEAQTHQQYESFKMNNSRDDKIRFEFDELNTKRAEIVRIYLRVHGSCLVITNRHMNTHFNNRRFITAQDPSICSREAPSGFVVRVALRHSVRHVFPSVSFALSFSYDSYCLDAFQSYPLWRPSHVAVDSVVGLQLVRVSFSQRLHGRGGVLMH